MRHLFTTAEARAAGLTDAALWWGEAHGRWRRVQRGVHADGPDDPTPLDAARARVLATSVPSPSVQASRATSTTSPGTAERRRGGTASRRETAIVAVTGWLVGR